MASIEESMAALREQAENARMLHGELTSVKQDMFTVTRNVESAYGGNPEQGLPTLLADATRHGNMVIASVGEAQRSLTVLREAIEEYVTSRGY